MSRNYELWSQSTSTYQGEIDEILANCKGKPKRVFDGVLTNEMALQRQNFRTDPFDFEVGEMIPGLSSVINSRFYDKDKEHLVMMIRELYLDAEIRFFDVVNYYSSKWVYPEFGGSDTVLVYLVKPADEKFIMANSNSLNMETSVASKVWIMPLVQDTNEYSQILAAMVSNIKVKTVSYTNCLRQAYVNCLKNRQETDMHVIALDFMLDIHSDLATTFQSNNGFPISLEKYLKSGKKVYKNKTADNAMQLNRFGFFMSALFRCSPGIFYPLNFYSQNGIPRKFIFTVHEMQVAAGLLTTWGNEKIGWAMPVEDANTNMPLFKKYFPQNYAPENAGGFSPKYLIPTNCIPQWVGMQKKMRGFLLRLFPFYWIAHTGEEPITFDHFINYEPPNIGRAVRSYSSYSVQSSQSGEVPIDFSNMFGSCNLFIDQCRSIRHNVRNQAISAKVKMNKHAIHESFDGVVYKPELVEKNNMNIWDENKRVDNTSNTPIRVRLLTDKFGDVPPTITGSKTSLSVSFYSYMKNK